MKRRAAAALLSVMLTAGMMTAPAGAQEAQKTQSSGTVQTDGQEEALGQAVEEEAETKDAESAASDETEEENPDQSAAEEAETENPDQSAAEEAETKDSTEEEAPDFTVKLDETEITVQNDSGIVFEKAEFEKEDDGETGTLTLTEEGGDVHTFEKVEETGWDGPVCYEEYGFIYIRYTNAQGEEHELIETADEKTPDQEFSVYATTNVNVRKAADRESERLGGVKTGDELTVVAAAPGWLKIKLDSGEGYVAHSYFTEDREEAEALKKAEEQAAAEAAAEQAAAQAAAAQAAAEQAAAEQAAAEQAAAEQAAAEQAAAEQAAAEQAAAEQAAAEQAAAEQAAAEQAAAEQAAAEQEAAEEAAASERTVVSTQDYPDCDGSGHGYREITYSDGTVEYQDY